MLQLLSMLAVAALTLSWLVSSHFPPWMSWHSEAAAFIAAWLFAWTSLAQSAGSQRPATVSFPLLLLPFAALMLLAVLQGATGMITYWGDVWVFTLYLVLCLICVTLGFGATARLPNALTWLASTLVVGALASAVIAWVQALGLWEPTDLIARMPQLRRPGGNLGQPNNLATLLLMGAASLMFLYESSKLKALSSVLIFLILGTALALTESRTGALSFLLLSGWWFAKNRRVGFRLSPWVIATATIGFLGFFWTWPAIFDFLLHNSELGSKVDTSAGARMIVWPQLLEALTQRPWWGWGLNQVPKAHNAVAHAYAVSSFFSYSHNILLDLALGVGVPLTALLFLVSAVWLWRRARFANQLLPWYCLAVALPVAVHSMLEFPFVYAYFLVPVMFVLGALEGMAGGKTAFRIGVRPAAALLLLVSVVGAWSVVEYVAIEEDFRVARFEALHIGQTPASYQKPDVVLLTQLGALLDGARILPKPGMRDDELALAKNVALRYPWPATQNSYALSLALNGNPAEAVRQMRVMRAMHGEKVYQSIKANWESLAQDQYPQLRGLNLP